MNTDNKLPLVAISAGDPNGIGYEILLKALSHPHIVEICTPVIYGNLSVAKKYMQTLDEDIRQMQLQQIDKIENAKEGKVNIINCYPDDMPLKIGEPTRESGRAAYISLSSACEDVKRGAAELLVTAPISKGNIQSEDFHFSGHTEYLTAQFGNAEDSLMMMISDQMRVALVTNHIPISEVPQYITEERILKKLKVLDRALRQDFNILKPRIAVLALNPHAGDNGLLGKEEQEVIRPTLKKANEQGLLVFGPYSADGFFGVGEYRHFDAILAMYHDQGLIPFKSLDMDGVNFTAGLNIIRTSPDHGTAFRLAGKNQATPNSFRNALYMALEVRRTRMENQQLELNKMQIVEQDENEN